MKTERLQLLQGLTIIKPALATKDLVEELTLIWFDGETAMAYNDAELGIQVPMETPFVGGICGSLLLGLLTNSRAKEIMLEEGKEGTIHLKAARTTAELSLMELDRSPWQFPKPSKKAQFDLTDAFLGAMKSALLAVGKDTSTPETLGITLYVDEDIAMFSTDTNTIAQVIIDHPKKGPQIKKTKHVTIPTAFCEQVLRLCPADTGFMEIRDDCVLAGDEDGVLIYARLLHASSPIDFWGNTERFEKWKKGSEFDIPERLSLALDRMAVLFDGMAGETMLVSLEDGVMELFAEVKGRGQVRDSVVIPDDVPPVKFRTQPGLIKRAMHLTSTMVCTEDAVRMAGDNGFVYLISTEAV